MDPVIGLSLGRVALGAISVARPDVGAKLFRLDAEHNRQLPYLTRLFGVRELALGAVTLVARGKARRRLVLVGIAVDGVDTAAGVIAGQDGSLSKNTSAILTAPAALAVLAGLSSLLGRDKRKKAKRATKRDQAAESR